MMASNNIARLIAFYLPQFHPIPENDKWWGKGFTEWTNVAKAKPLFPGHYQPHLPADLGFYDLRLPETRQAQADMARTHGIHGFCYYHYWFGGRRLLETPFEEVLRSTEPDFPFCLCWANESWRRNWDGRSGDHLIRQTYSEQDDRAHLRWLLRAFEDERYIRVEGKPLFLVYRASQLPAPRRTTELWRHAAKDAGLPGLYLARVESMKDERTEQDPVELGFDAAVEFQPNWGLVGRELARKDPRAWWRRLLCESEEMSYRVYDYGHLVRAMLSRTEPDYLRFPCVAPRWDNTPRRKKEALILSGSSPELYECWLRSVVEHVRAWEDRPKLVFINAWNEWAEGAHLEPDQKHGLAYLEATARAVGWDE